jgi:hypothetical protein
MHPAVFDRLTRAVKALGFAVGNVHSPNETLRETLAGQAVQALLLCNADERLRAHQG